MSTQDAPETGGGVATLVWALSGVVLAFVLFQLLQEGRDGSGGDAALALLKAAASGESEQVEGLLDEGYVVDEIGPAGWAPLHYAAHLGRTDVAELLIERGANVDLAGTQGLTPLHRAAAAGRTGTVRLLLERGARSEARSENGETPLLLALSGDVSETALVLLERGADVSLPELRFGLSALHVATANGNAPLVAALLERGASTTYAVKTGQTALHVAAAADRLDLIDLLLAGGAVVNASDSDGNTPLHFAVERGARVAAARLLEVGAEPTLRNAAGFDAPALASRAGHSALQAMLVPAREH